MGRVCVLESFMVSAPEKLEDKGERFSVKLERIMLITHYSLLLAHCVKLQSSSCAQESAPGP